MVDNLRFLSNNVNRLHSSKKCVKIFEHFKGQIVDSGIIFLQATHSSEEIFNVWQANFRGEVFSSHHTGSSCSVMIGYFDNKMFLVNKISKDNN